VAIQIAPNLHVNCNCPLARHDAIGGAACDSLHSCALLESLDDAMFAAIGGDDAALAQARRLWVEACAALSPELLDESREQYLRYAAEVSRELSVAAVRRPAQMLAAVEIMELLTRP
jgi:hypothetical protein